MGLAVQKEASQKNRLRIVWASTRLCWRIANKTGCISQSVAERYALRTRSSIGHLYP
jgi:hypothetical protein